MKEDFICDAQGDWIIPDYPILVKILFSGFLPSFLFPIKLDLDVEIEIFP